MKEQASSLKSTKTLTSALVAFACASLLFFVPSPAANAVEELKVPSGAIIPNVLPNIPKISSKRLTPPDLIVSSLSNPPPGAAPGSVIITVAATRNIGAAPSLSASITKFYFSADQSVGNDLFIGDWMVPESLAPGTDVTGRSSVIIPSTLPIGSYYLLACADGGGTVPETNEMNNCLFSRTKIILGKPDLIVSRAKVPGGPSGEFEMANPRAVSGGTIQVNDTIMNSGVSPAMVETSTAFFLSIDKLPGSDTYLGERIVGAGLAAGGINSGMQTLTIPTQTPNGPYYLLACADANGAMPEANENNNCLCFAILNVGPLDLGVSSLYLPVTSVSQIKAGSSIYVSDTTSTPNGSIPTTMLTYTSILLSRDNIAGNDVAIGFREIPRGISSNSGTGQYTIPSTTPAGTYYLLACADSADDLEEDNEGNNCAQYSTPIIVTAGSADLVVDSFPLLPASADRGGTISLNDSTRNIGASPTTKRTYTSYSISTDQLLNGNYRILGRREVPANLAPGAASSSSYAVTVPAVVAAGSYYLFACADSDKEEMEGNETNNCLLSSRTITINPGYPDLVVELPQPLLASAKRGFVIQVEAYTKNIGVARQNNVDTYTRFHLSSDLAVGNDYYIGEWKVLSEYVIEGGRDVGYPKLMINTQIPIGYYYLRVCADETGVMHESNETNNCTYSTTRIEIKS